MPAIAPDGTVYVLTEGPGSLHALAKDGQRKWKANLGMTAVAKHLPLVLRDGTVHILDEKGKGYCAVSPVWARAICFSP